MGAFEVHLQYSQSMELSDMRFWLGGEWTRYSQQLLNKFLSSPLIYVHGSSECIQMSLNTQHLQEAFQVTQMLRPNLYWN
jgi:hypothetical protein